MTPCCIIGGHAQAVDIDAALRAGDSLGTVAKRFGLVRGTVGKHRAGCLGMKALAPPGDTPETGTETPPETAQKTAETGGQPSSPFAVPNPSDDALTAPRKVIAATVERACVELRVKGRSYDAIGEELGIDPDTAMDAVERVLLRTRGKADELAEAARALEVRRCDAIIASFWERATDPAMVEVLVPADNEAGVKKYDGQDKAADRLLKAMERRAKLLGLDASSGPLVSVQVLLASPDFRRIQEALVEALRPWPDAMRAAALALRGIA